VTVYLLHFTEPYKHARHYVGVATHVQRRLQHHRTGSGARLLAAVAAAGIDFVVARTWRGGRKLERKIKRNEFGSTRLLCPVCSGKRRTLRVLRRERVRARVARRRARLATVPHTAGGTAYCGNQLCCWGPAGTRPLGPRGPRKVAA